MWNIWIDSRPLWSIYIPHMKLFLAPFYFAPNSPNCYQCLHSQYCLYSRTQYIHEVTMYGNSMVHPINPSFTARYMRGFYWKVKIREKLKLKLNFIIWCLSIAASLLCCLFLLHKWRKAHRRYVIWYPFQLCKPLAFSRFIHPAIHCDPGSIPGAAML